MFQKIEGADFCAKDVNCDDLLKLRGPPKILVL